MTHEKGTSGSAARVAEWPFPLSAALGSSVRASGIEREIRARLPWTARKCVAVENGCILLRMAADDSGFDAAAAVVGKVLEGIDGLPVLPREVEDILSLTSHERQKWTRDGRLKSAGTRTVKLRGRSKAVTFHVFEPRHIEDLLDRDAAAVWRQEDAEAKAEARRRAAGKAALTRAGKGVGKAGARETRPAREEAPPPALKGWDMFASEGLLR